MEPFENIKLSFNCPKKLDELQACGKNWSCASCQKMVYDFRGMTETQILDIFMQSGQKLCGIYEAERFSVLAQKPRWHKWLSAAMVMLGLGAMSQVTYAQQVKIGKAVSNPVKSDSVAARTYTLGEVVIEPRADFRGGYAALQQYLLKHIGNKEHFTGVMSATFIVEANGTVGNVIIEKSGGIQMDVEMKKALQNSPKWTPAQSGGKVISSHYTVQVDFARTAE